MNTALIPVKKQRIEWDWKEEENPEHFRPHSIRGLKKRKI
jgi:hypothetical protein